MKYDEFGKDKAGISAVIGVILMVAITVAICATVYVYVSSMVSTDYDEDEFLINNAMQNYTWNVPENFSMGLENPVRYTSLHEYSSNWYKVSVKLKSEIGPWDYLYWAWFNIETEETYLQLKN